MRACERNTHGQRARNRAGQRRPSEARPSYATEQQLRHANAAYSGAFANAAGAQRNLAHWASSQAAARRSPHDGTAESSGERPTKIRIGPRRAQWRMRTRRNHMITLARVRPTANWTPPNYLAQKKFHNALDETPQRSRRLRRGTKTTKFHSTLDVDTAPTFESRLLRPLNQNLRQPEL